MQQRKMVFVLWANHLEETVASVFVTELRRMGLPVKIIGLQRQALVGSFGLAMVPDLTLEQAAPQFCQACCLILPGPIERMNIFSQHPRLCELMAFIAIQGIFVVAASPAGTEQIGNAEYSSSIAPLIYPIDDGLFSFARNLASRLMSETRSPVAVTDAATAKTTQGTRQHFHRSKEGFLERSILRVAGSSLTGMLAGAVAGQIRQRQRSELQAIGMGAVYKTVKAVIIAQEYLRPEGISLACIPHFVEAGTVEDPRTAVRFTVYQRMDDAVAEPPNSWENSVYI
jgi:stage V sporulation protein SpoVS